MARVPTFTDQIAVARRQREDIRQLRSRRRCHAESKTFIIPGALTTSLYVPPFWVAIDVDGESPEYKTVYAFRAVLGAGTCTVQWLINGVQIGADHLVTTTANEHEVTIDPTTWPAAVLQDGDIVRPVFSAVSGGGNFSGAVYMQTAAA